MPPLPTPTARSTVLTGQIITIMLMLGVLLFGGIALVITQPQPQQPNQSFLALLGAAAAGGLAVLRVVLPPLIAASACRRIQPVNGDSAVTAEQLYPVYQTTLIIGAALLEGGAFFNLVLYIIAGQWWSFAISVGLWLGIAGGIPTQYGLERWVANRLAEIQLAGGSH